MHLIFLSNYFQHNDYVWLTTVAKSLTHFQSVFGQIPTVCGIGRAAKVYIIFLPPQKILSNLDTIKVNDACFYLFIKS